MATLLSDKCQVGMFPKAELNENVVVARYNLAAALADEDIIQMVPVPKGAVITGIDLQVPDLDTGGSPTISLQVGDGGDTDRFVVAGTIGQAAGAHKLNSVVGLGFKYTAADTIDIRVDTVPATGATAGEIVMVARYTLEPN